MRLCFLTQEDIVVPPGGTGTYVRNIATYLAGHGHDVHIISRRLPGMAAEAVHEGVRIHRINAPGPAVLYSPIYFAGAARRLSVLERDGPFDAIHGNLPLLSSLGIQGGPRRRFVETVHCSVVGEIQSISAVSLRSLNWNEGVFRVLRPLIAAAERRVLGRATRVIAVSAGLVDEIELVAPGVRAKTSVIPNGVDVRRFRPSVDRTGVRAHLGLDPEAPLVLYLGRLMERKRVVDLVRALPAIRVAVPGARLAIVGRRTSYLARVMAEVSALGVSEAVSVIEHVPHAEVPSVLGAADCFVLPSAYEGFPFTILEAMACGVPVVGTAIPGIVDQIVSGENGLLVPVARPAELATAISSLLADPVLAGRLAGAARERVEAAYTWEAVGAQHERLFEAVAA